MSFESNRSESGGVNFELFKRIHERLSDEDLTLKIKVLERQVQGGTSPTEEQIPDLLNPNFADQVDKVATSETSRKQLEILYEIQDSRAREQKAA